MVYSDGGVCPYVRPPQLLYPRPEPLDGISLIFHRILGSSRSAPSKIRLIFAVPDGMTWTTKLISTVLWTEQLILKASKHLVA